jgi:hypothetical protein
MGQELREILTFCQDFDSRVKDAASFAAYMASCQLETTMSFNDYYVDPLNLPLWPSKPYVWGAVAGGGALVLGLAATLLLLILSFFTPAAERLLPWVFGLSILGAVVLAVVVVVAYGSMMAAGAKSFPAAPDSTLPIVLKALHLRRAFTRFAIDSQIEAAGTDESSAQKLYDDFAAFVAANKPYDLVAPTQPPGVIGI